MSKTEVKFKSIEIDITGEIEEITRKAGKDCVNLLKQRSPRVTGDYADGWTYEMENNNRTARVFNDGPDKTLTHLLEFGHRTKLGKKSGKQKHSAKSRKRKSGPGRKRSGRKATVAPQEHIRPVYNIIKDEYLKNLESIKMKVKK